MDISSINIICPKTMNGLINFLYLDSLFEEFGAATSFRSGVSVFNLSEAVP